MARSAGETHFAPIGEHTTPLKCCPRRRIFTYSDSEIYFFLGYMLLKLIINVLLFVILCLSIIILLLITSLFSLPYLILIIVLDINIIIIFNDNNKKSMSKN